MQKILNRIIIPILTIFVTTRSSFLYENVTYIANHTQHRFLVCILAILLSYHYFSSFKIIFKQTHFKNTLTSKLLLLTTLSITIAFLIPYNPSLYPLFSKLHVLFSLGGAIVFILLLNIFFWFIQTHHIDLYRKTFGVYLSLISGCISIFVWFGSVNSLLELYFILMINLLIEMLLKNSEIF